MAQSILELPEQTPEEVRVALERMGEWMGLHSLDIQRIVPEFVALRPMEDPVTIAPQGKWEVRRLGAIDEVVYGEGPNYPQYAALHRDSSYFRLVSHPGSGWGTSIILLPSFWAAGEYKQGAPVAMTWRAEGRDLIGSFVGQIFGLRARGQLRLLPPEPNLMTAVVMVVLDGYAAFDTRDGEGFKPVALSSMHIAAHIAADVWDASCAAVEFQSYAIPEEQWSIAPPTNGRMFGLRGGTSEWKKNAPTVEIMLDRPMQITGWVTPSCEPNDDNVSLWAASDSPIRFWEYRIFSRYGSIHETGGNSAVEKV